MKTLEIPEMQKNNLENLFDIIGEKFDSQESIFLTHLEQMSRFCSFCFSRDEIEGKTILDAGCGTGTASTYFSKCGAGQVYGVDLSQRSLEVAQKVSTQYGLHNIEFQKADMLSLPFDSETFDIVFSCGVLPYVENIFEALDELIRITKRNGKFVLMLLKKTRLDGFYNFLRLILSRLPISRVKNLAKFLALSSRPIANLFLKRQVNFSQAKPLEQTILESLFSPVKLNRQYPKEIQAFFENKGFKTSQIKDIKGVDFYSPSTGFIIKAVRNG